MGSTLFQPCEIANLGLQNRVVMAPMTRSRALDDGTPTAMMAEYYAQRSEAGLIVSEGANISPQGQGFLNTPGIFNAAQVEGWRAVTQRVHAGGSRLFLQLWHVGRIAHPDNMAPGLGPVAPSAIGYERTVVTASGPQALPVPREMHLQEVRQTIADYARAARLAIEAGCDGVEIHGANGYLPSQFLHESSNRRTDEYGGSIDKRARFIVEVARACADAVGARRVAVRLTPFSVFNGAESADDAAVYSHLIPALAALELGYLHVVGAEVSGNQTIEPRAGVEVRDVLAFTRPLWPHALVAAGGYDLARAEAAVQQGRADLIAFGRDFIGNPDLVSRMRARRALVERRPADWYAAGAEGYTDYPRWDRQDETR